MIEMRILFLFPNFNYLITVWDCGLKILMWIGQYLFFVEEVIMEV
jgi:hypothetical protein